nr:Chain C, Nuclear receptor coactivator 2 [Homo sapiens]5ICK_D Chain D, Nuclear receptor coactivator 2 [Homo sapiens]
NALLRYLLDKD